MAPAIARLRTRRVAVRWNLPPFEAGVGIDRERRSPVADVVDEAVLARARATGTRGERLLRKLGIHVIGRRERDGGGQGGAGGAPSPGDRKKAS